MDKMLFNCHEIEIFMKLGVVFRFLGVHSILSYDGLRQRCSITFSKDSMLILEKDSHMHYRNRHLHMKINID